MEWDSLASLASLVAAQKIFLCADSRKVTPGCVFFALPGNTVDGGVFIEDAVSRGAAWVVCRPEHTRLCGPAKPIVCLNPRQAMGSLANAFYETASLPFPVIGVTGTNGKTTVTYLLDHMFLAGKKKTGVLGTITYRWPGHEEDAPLTTPDCLELHAMFAQMRETGVEVACMEVSSHALEQDRVAGVAFKGAVFTNLTQDHLDYHKDMEAYFQAKSRLFLHAEGRPFTDRVMAVGTDNIWGAKLARMLPEPIRYGLQPRPEKNGRYLKGEILSNAPEGLHLRMSFEDRIWDLKSPLVGQFNAENLLAVQALGLGLNFNPADFKCFETFGGVPGRLERILNPQEFNIFVDYAHTPDALINVLSALRSAGFKRLVTVFGCGGNRDRTKRPLMGEAVAQLSDVAVLTSDNPRHEDPEAIMNDTMPGLAGAGLVIKEVDRRQAIKKALELLLPGDALLVAGKGHERTQQIGSVKYPFSDQQVIREMLGCV